MLRAAVIRASLPPNLRLVNVLADEEVGELPRVAGIQPVAIVCEAGEQVVAGRQWIPVRSAGVQRSQIPAGDLEDVAPWKIVGYANALVGMLDHPRDAAQDRTGHLQC